MKSYDSLLLLGASGSGKTTLVRSLFIPKYETDVVVPLRYTTRPPREDDDHRITKSVYSGEFYEMVDDGGIDQMYEKRYGADRREVYGFASVPQVDRRLRIYSATGSAIDRTSARQMRNLMFDSFVTVLQINAKTRAERVNERNPNMDVAERNSRADRDAEVAIAARHHADLIIDTGALSITEEVRVFHGALDQLIAARSQT